MSEEKGQARDTRVHVTLLYSKLDKLTPLPCQLNFLFVGLFVVIKPENSYFASRSGLVWPSTRKDDFFQNDQLKNSSPNLMFENEHSHS